MGIKKTITLEYETWYNLTEAKHKLKFSTLNDLIFALLNESSLTSSKPKIEAQTRESVSPTYSNKEKSK
jgi:macrodomain Ter protein organizer (MatP/YcbG family)